MFTIDLCELYGTKDFFNFKGFSRRQLNDHTPSPDVFEKFIMAMAAKAAVVTSTNIAA